MTTEHSHTSMPGHIHPETVNLADAQVFCAIWKANKESLYWLAYKVLDNQQEAQDVITESFVKLYHSTNTFNTEAAVRGWLRVTVRNGYCCGYGTGTENPWLSHLEPVILTTIIFSKCTKGLWLN